MCLCGKIVHLKEAVTYLNGLNGLKNGKDGHLDGHLDGHFECWKNETFRLDGHLDGHFLYYFFLICLYVWYKYRVVLLVFKLLQGVNDILGIIIYSPVF